MRPFIHHSPTRLHDSHRRCIRQCLERRLWRDVTKEESLAIDSGQRVLFPKAFRLLKLDVTAFRDLARNAPLELSLGADEAAPVILLPMPDGSFARFRLQESPIMDVQLAARLPEVKTYRARH